MRQRQEKEGMGEEARMEWMGNTNIESLNLHLATLHLPKRPATC